MPTSVESARQEWYEGHRRLQAESRDRDRYERLMVQVEVVTEELRRRLGQTFTLSELAALYPEAERWTREAVARHVAAGGMVGSLALVEDAAFHLYSRGAIDFSP